MNWWFRSGPEAQSHSGSFLGDVEGKGGGVELCTSIAAYQEAHVGPGVTSLIRPFLISCSLNGS